MKKILNVFKAVTAVMVLLISFIACDKDFTTIGTDVIGGNNFNAASYSYPVITYNNKLEAVQTNGLSSNLLGFYSDPIYGTSKTNIVSQMSLFNVSSSTDFKENVVLDSVVLTVPYFSHTDTNSDTGYALDSVYGNTEIPIKLSVYRNNYFLSDYDSGSDFEDSQKYYSNGETSSGGTIPTPNEILNQLDLLFNEDNSFEGNPIPSSKGIVLKTNNYDVDEIGEEEVIETLSPSLRLILESGVNDEELQFWKELIIDKEGQTEISNTNNFKDYFRGIYFKVEEASIDGQMVLLNFASSKANITIYYKSINEYDDLNNNDIPDFVEVNVNGTVNGIDTDNDGLNDESDVDADGNDEDDEGKVDINDDGIDDNVVSVNESTIILNFTGNRVNISDNDFNTIIDDANANANDITGDEKLYLKGGEGSMAVIDLFKGLVEDDNGNEILALDHFENTFKNTDGGLKRLINEAYLVFYEDETYITSSLSDDHIYDRLYLYDLENNQPMIDYFYDVQSTTSPYYSIINHLGQRTGETGNYKFKIKITEHLNNILLRDSTNTKLGLVLSTNVNSFQNVDILGAADEDVNKIPSGSVLSPIGTVLHGNSTISPDKKVKLEIYYTEPE